MKRKTLLSFVPLLLLSAIAGCDKGGSSSVQAPKVSIPPIVFEKELDLQRALGVGIGNGPGDPLFKKKLGTSVGGEIEIKQMYVWKHNSRDWEQGGKLHLINDDHSPSSGTRVVCSVSPQTGDRWMKDPITRDITIRGTIKSYSSSDGLFIEPCLATW
jgi:hypothetical protein